jgi:hypothetical protein
MGFNSAFKGLTMMTVLSVETCAPTYPVARRHDSEKWDKKMRIFLN